MIGPNMKVEDVVGGDTTPLVHQLLPARSSLRTDWRNVGQNPMTEKIFDIIEP